MIDEKSALIDQIKIERTRLSLIFALFATAHEVEAVAVSSARLIAAGGLTTQPQSSVSQPSRGTISRPKTFGVVEGIV